MLARIRDWHRTRSRRFGYESGKEGRKGVDTVAPGGLIRWPMPSRTCRGRRTPSEGPHQNPAGRFTAVHRTTDSPVCAVICVIQLRCGAGWSSSRVGQSPPSDSSPLSAHASTFGEPRGLHVG